MQKLRPSHNLMNEEFILSLSSNNETQAPVLSNGRGVQEHLGEQGSEGPTDCSFPAAGCDSDDSRPHDSVVDSKRQASTENPAAGQWAVFSIHAMLLKDRAWQSRCRSQEIKLAN